MMQQHRKIKKLKKTTLVFQPRRSVGGYAGVRKDIASSASQLGLIQNKNSALAGASEGAEEADIAASPADIAQPSSGQLQAREGH